MTVKMFFIPVLLSMVLSMRAQQGNAFEIIQACIHHHDPNRRWQNLRGKFDYKIIRNGAKDRTFEIFFDNKKNTFKYQITSDSLRFSQSFENEKYYSAMNENVSLSDLDKIKFNLTDERTLYLKEVYTYLMGLPMLLADDFRFMKGDVEEAVFNGSQCYKISFEYLPINENETWCFYINKFTFILEGYRFFKEDASLDGEFIFLEDYQKMDGILIPAVKKWYWNKDGSFFRTDTTLKFSKR